ncbi:class I SAM-dependent rRNA methyltransferase [uncultured Mailhella sp.]|uniref:class I SAM-dependent rRNA methyltransferase n=1 Tax=uncultured Mailhella sp. TaxID=1981031 RepID=UPI0025E9A487|nr:class I SAM-dependent rRNA methyltransferase [uncultured Mailhella sp.]
METVFLKKGEDRRLRIGHLWVFSNEIDTKRSPLGSFAPGQSVLVADCGGRPLGTGYVNPASLIAVRMVSRKADEVLDASLLHRRLSDALALRERMFRTPFYRLCHGEGDFLPGLVADRHGDHVVCQITTAGMDAHTDELLSVLDSLLHPSSILLDNNVASRDLEGLERFQRVASGDVPEEISVEENGMSYAVPLKNGQKTGWFYDQRVNRAALTPFVQAQQGCSVLDAFCYAGGFGALAAKNGAGKVTFMDASAHALSYAKRNAEQFGTETELLQGDALTLLADLRREGRTFDIVCLDPPAFIKRKKDAKQGLEAYQRVNEIGLDLVRPGGMLMTCSCSHHLEADALRGLVTRAAGKRRRHARLLFQGFQGPDHPIHPAMPETAYLKTFLFHLPE